MNIPLLIMLFVAHYLCDYSHLSTPWMLKAKRVGAPLPPIFAHALVHSIAMGFICNLYLGFPLLNGSMDICDGLFAIQFFSHFIIDTLKGKCNVWFPQVATPQNNSHWYIFGLDQLLHHLVIVLMWSLTLNS